MAGMKRSLGAVSTWQASGSDCVILKAQNLYEDSSKKPEKLDFHDDICDYFMTKSRDVHTLHLRAIFYLYLFDSEGVSHHFFDYKYLCFDTRG